MEGKGKHSIKEVRQRGKETDGSGSLFLSSPSAKKEGAAGVHATGLFKEEEKGYFDDQDSEGLGNFGCSGFPHYIGSLLQHLLQMRGKKGNSPLSPAVKGNLLARTSPSATKGRRLVRA